MQILTYKRTHTGDPNPAGEFGIHDCMGRVRSWGFDAVIGVGGLGAEPRSFGIDRRVTWVGLNPTWTSRNSGRGQIVTFESFRLLDEHGPILQDLAPHLARRIYEKMSRMVFRSYSQTEKEEAVDVISTVLSEPVVPFTATTRRQLCRKQNSCRPCKPQPNNSFKPKPLRGSA